METNKNVLVHADHVKVYFKGKDKKSGAVRAVDDVSFDIMKGETFGVVGESGCGKSTLGRTLIKLIPATDGHIYLDGEDISGLKGSALKQMRKKAQIIFQDPSACLNPRRTVRQIMMEPFEIHHMTGKMDVDARIEELLHLVGLDTYHLSRYPHELSGGQKQRIGHCPRAGTGTGTHHLRGGGFRAGCIGAGAGVKPAAGVKGASWTDVFLYLAQLKCCVSGQRPRWRDVSWQDG